LPLPDDFTRGIGKRALQHDTGGGDSKGQRYDQSLKIATMIDPSELEIATAAMRIHKWPLKCRRPSTISPSGVTNREWSNELPTAIDNRTRYPHHCTFAQSENPIA
jgi:hypothetical protein